MTDADLQYPCIGVALCRAPGRGSCRGIPWTRLVRSVLSRAGAAFRSRGSLVRRGEGHGAQRHHIDGASRAAHQTVAVPGQEGRRDDQGETPSADAAVHVHARGPRPAQPARRSDQSRPPGDQGLGRGNPHDEEGGAGHGGRTRRRGAHRRVRLRARHQGARGPQGGHLLRHSHGLRGDEAAGAFSADGGAQGLLPAVGRFRPAGPVPPLLRLPRGGISQRG